MLNNFNPTIAMVDIKALPIEIGPSPCLPAHAELR